MECCADQCGLVVEDDSDGGGGEQVGEAAFVGERPHEAAVLEFGQDPRWDAATQVDTAGRHQLQRQVAGLGTIDLDHQIKRRDRHLVRPRQCQPGDLGGGQRAATGEMTVDIDQADPRANTLVADMPMLAGQKLTQPSWASLRGAKSVWPPSHANA